MSNSRRSKKHKSPLSSFRDEFRREAARIIRSHPCLQATEWCGEVLSDACSRLGSFLGSFFNVVTTVPDYGRIRKRPNRR